MTHVTVQRHTNALPLSKQKSITECKKGVDHSLLLSYSLQGLQHDDAVSPDDL